MVIKQHMTSWDSRHITMQATMLSLHNDVIATVLQSSLAQSLNVALSELHVGFGVAKLLRMVVHVTPGHLQLSGRGHKSVYYCVW